VKSSVCYAIAGIGFALGASVSTPARGVQEPVTSGLIDDNAPGWTWSGMTLVSDSQLGGGTGHAGGPGTYGVYAFSGAGVDVIAMRGPAVADGGRSHRTGKLKVMIDGQEKDTVNLAAAENEYNVKVFHVAGLSNGTHVLELDPVGGWVVVDGIDIAGAAPAGAVSSSTGNAFSDDFQDGTASAWTPYGGAWIVYNGLYEINGGSGNKSLVTGSDYRNLTYQADILVANGDDAGLVFRVQKPSVGTDAYTGYYAGLDFPHQRVIIGKADNNWQLLAQQSYSLALNRIYHFKVVARDNAIAVFVDGHQVVTVEDGSYASGAIGVRTFNSSAAFGHIRAALPAGK
jgi:hypothetical protein